jgi:hypothetical protein
LYRFWWTVGKLPKFRRAGPRGNRPQDAAPVAAGCDDPAHREEQDHAAQGLCTAHEEVLSSNEELETAKEELTTVNEEL